MKGVREQLRARMVALGFDEVRFARLDRTPDAEANALTRWIAAGGHADMEWMARSVPKRLDPECVLPGARSAVLLGINYTTATDPAAAGPRWARYALYSDYHDTLRPALAAAGRVLEELCGLPPDGYRYYTDTGPVLERSWAERGGLGFVGKNAMLISRSAGNWLFLAEILTTLDLEPDPPLAPGRAGAGADPSRVGLYCGSCTRCITACPTAAIRSPGVVDARRCISYQTIENRGIIPREMRPLFGDRIYGCDTCLEVCPWNRFARQGRRVLLQSRDELARLSLRELLHLDAARFAEVFRGTAIKRTKLAGILRNACIVAANTGARDCLGRLVELAGHPSAVVRAHAVWATFVLAGSANASSLLAAARAAETDASVLDEYAVALGTGVSSPPPGRPAQP
jgi:epoxyqueuosine reductase